MKTIRKSAILFVLLSILLVSGCVMGPKTKAPTAKGGKTYGLVISEFSALPSIDSNDIVDLNIYSQNQGEGTAKDITVSLYQRGGFDINEGRTPRDQTYAELLPPEPELNTPGDVFSTFWSLTAPTVKEDQFKSLKARVTYDYDSIATTNIYLVAKEEWDEKGAASFKTYSTSSIAPITVSIIEVPAVRISDSSTRSKKVSLNILFANTGTGTLIDGELRNFQLLVKRAGQQEEDVSNYCGITGGLVKMYGAEQSRALRCDFPLDFNYDDGSMAYILEAKIDYTYYIDTPAVSIKILKPTGEVVMWPKAVLKGSITRSGAKKSGTLTMKAGETTCFWMDESTPPREGDKLARLNLKSPAFEYAGNSVKDPYCIATDWLAGTTHTVTLKVWDEDGNTDTDTLTVKTE